MCQKQELEKEQIKMIREILALKKHYLAPIFHTIQEFLSIKPLTIYVALQLHVITVTKDATYPVSPNP